MGLELPWFSTYLLTLTSFSALNAPTFHYHSMCGTPVSSTFNLLFATHEQIHWLHFANFTTWDQSLLLLFSQVYHWEPEFTFIHLAAAPGPGTPNGVARARKLQLTIAWEDFGDFMVQTGIGNSMLISLADGQWFTAPESSLFGE